MAIVSRANLVTGPARIVRGAVSLFSQDDLTLNVVNETFDVRTSAHGRTDARYSDARVDLSFTPDGRITTGIAGLLGILLRDRGAGA